MKIILIYSIVSCAILALVYLLSTITRTQQLISNSLHTYKKAWAIVDVLVFPFRLVLMTTLSTLRALIVVPILSIRNLCDGLYINTLVAFSQKRATKVLKARMKKQFRVQMRAHGASEEEIDNELNKIAEEE